MLPEIHLGPFTLQTFGLMFALSFVVAGAIIHRRLGELGKPQDWAYEMAFAALIGGLILGMIDSVVTTTISGDIAIILSFVVIFLVLVFRPSGLFGQKWD